MAETMLNESSLVEKASEMDQSVEDEAIIEIKKMIQDCNDLLLLPECCIYRVPTTLRHLREEAYTPKVVSIGPFHYNKRLQDMIRHKHGLFKKFITRIMPSLDDLVRLVHHLLPKVRASYSETIETTEQELVELTLMDAGFIIELFISYFINEPGEDATLLQPWLGDSIRKDLLLLENQLPFFVIEELFNEAFPHKCQGSLPSFLNLTYAYFEYFNIQERKPDPNVKINHFTDLIRLFYLPKTMPQMHYFKEGGGNLLYNANALQEVGIKFKASKSTCPLDLKFSGRQLEIPHILVEDGTELLFRNMIALEQCHYPYGSYITEYALMLDYLVETHQDVDLLVHNEIVTNKLGDSNNVALLFNCLGAKVTQACLNSEYHDIYKRLNERYRQGHWHKMKETLRRDYCRTPWQFVASTAAIVLLLLTIVQTIFSILQVVKK